MLELRPYQREAIDALYEYWATPDTGNGLIVLPTGAGKALVIAKIIEELLCDYPGMRIVNITHSAPLVEQNFKEFIGLAPFAPAGIYSASLGRRDARAQVLFCNIQSVANKVEELGDMDLVLVDEAQGIGRNTNTQYGKFFRAFRKQNPNGRVAGTTATDYRLDTGRLTDDMDSDGEVDEDGKPVRFKLFDDVVYEAILTDLIRDGFLTQLVSHKTTAKIDLKGVGTRGGEYIPGQLSDAADRIIEEAIAEDMAMSADRRAGLFFCASQKNAIHIRDAIRRHGRTCEALTSDNAHEAKRIFTAFRAGELWSIVSVNMIYTGTNFPFVDFLSLIFSTKSAGKLVQALGRGTRNFPGKEDCLVADHGKNLAFHGPIDQIRPKAPGSGDGEAPKKVCPDENTPGAVKDENGAWGCGELIHASAKECHCCHYKFPPSQEVKITATAADAPVLSIEKPTWRQITKRTFRFHEGKGDKPPSVKCTYFSGLTQFNEWLCFQHTGFAQSKAHRWWSQHGGERPFPTTVMAALERQGELAETESISVRPDGKYWSVVGHRVATAAIASNDNTPVAGNDNVDYGALMEDEIPF